MNTLSPVWGVARVKSKFVRKREVTSLISSIANGLPKHRRGPALNAGYLPVALVVVAEALVVVVVVALVVVGGLVEVVVEMSNE